METKFGYLIFFILLFSCSKNNDSKLGVRIIESPEIDLYNLELNFKGPAKFDFNTTILRFNNNQKIFNPIHNLENIDSIKKGELIIESENKNYRYFSQMPINIYFDMDYLDLWKDTIYNINIKNNEHKIILFKRNFPIEYFYFDDSEKSKKIRFHFIPQKKDAHVISSNWVDIPTQ